MVNRITAEVVGIGNGVTLVFNATLSKIPVRRGTVSIAYTIAATPHIATDNGLGVFSGVSVSSSSTINYTTGAIHLVFTVAPDNAINITASYDQHQGLPVMGVMNFYTQLNTRELIVADTKYVNKYNSTTNRLDDISPSTLLTGSKFNFMSWVNYPDPQNLQRLLFVNFKDPVQRYNGTTVTPYPIYTASTAISIIPSGVVGNGTTGPYTITIGANKGILPGSLTISTPTGPQVVTDNQFGQLTGNGTGTVDYLSGTIVVTFSANVPAAEAISIAYQQLNTPIDTALHIFQFKDRLVVEYPIENGIQYGHRIRVSGTGAFGDVFTSDAIGAGIIDIPADSFISSSDFNRDDLLIFIEDETWVVKYTQNDVIPFALDRIDGTRGSQAPYGTITYLNRTNAYSPLGLILSDGYSVDRSDDKIPDFSYNTVDQNNFKLCFAGSVDRDRDHYLIFPSSGSSTSDQILVTNYEEDNYCIYRIPLSCMGNYIETHEVTWNDLLQFDSWDQMATVYGNWNSFSFSKGTPISIGGGQRGEIVRLNDTETEDYPVKIRNITVIDGFTLEVTTDFKSWVEGDFIAFEAVSGMTQLNNKQAAITGTPASNYVFRVAIDTSNFAAYTGGGTASKCIVFDSKTKKFNPFANYDKKVSCGWLYFYVSTTGTDLTVNQHITNATLSNPCVLTVPGHNYNNNTQVFVNGVAGTVELNGQYSFITVIDSNNISLNEVDSTGYTAYVSGGFTSTPQNAILQVRCITNDNEQSTIVPPYNPSPYQVNLTNLQSENGIKKWYKLWINQTARFIQFEIINNQSGATVQIHAIMPGFAGIGRMV